MGLQFGNLIGAANSIASGFSEENSLQQFLTSLDDLGVQITSRYECIFSAIPQTTFFIKNISTPTMRQNSTMLHFDGKEVEIPQNFEYTHDFSMTVINDASGIIYSALCNFIMNDFTSKLVNSGYSITIKTAKSKNTNGTTITLNDVRVKNIGALQFDHAGGDVQTFNVDCTAVDFTTSMGQTGKIGGIVGAIEKLIS